MTGAPAVRGQPGPDRTADPAADAAPRRGGGRVLLACRGLVKSFPGVRAVRGVDFTIEAGRVRGLVGENGAGKSTLARIIAGVHRPDAGTMELEGVPVSFASADQALARRIVTVHQDINLIATMTVAENILLNNEPCRGPGILRRQAMHDAVAGLLAQYEIAARPDDLVAALPNDVRKMVQIVKAVAREPRILLLDEPTSSLTGAEVGIVLRLIRRLAGEGVGIVLISHYLNEIFAVCDELTVMREGAVVADGPVRATTLPAVVAAMVGRTLDERRRAAEPRDADAREPLLRVEALTVPGRIRDVGFTLHAGEVLGVTGLAGSGLGDLSRAVFGAVGRGSTGRITVEGRELRLGEPARALAAGIALLTGDRLREGILLDFPLTDNVCLPILSRFSRRSGALDRAAMLRTTEHAIARLRVRAPGPLALARQLSGGNQQKLLFGRWLETGPKVFVMDEPTIGVDVGSKEEIRGIVGEIARAGVGVLLVTTELEELVLLCDRVLIMFRGTLVGELAGAAIEREAILQASACGAIGVAA